MTADQRSVLLCGGPGDGRRVQVPSNDTHFTVVTEDASLPRTAFHLPRRVHTVYRITMAQTHTGPTWVGVVWDAPKEQQETDAQGALLAETWREIQTQTTLLKEKLEMPQHPTPPTKTDVVHQLCRTIPGLSGATASAIYDMIAAHAKGTEPETLDDGLEHITIKTRNPDKWRFLDTETAETWRWDVEEKKFTKVTYHT